MVRREAVEEVGPFDEKFFLFMEEADWCLRMRRSGWEIYYLPHLTAIHHHGASKRKLESASWIEYYRSTYIYFRKNRGFGAYVWLRFLRFCKMFVNLGLTTLFRSDGSSPRPCPARTRNTPILFPSTSSSEPS